MPSYSESVQLGLGSALTRDFGSITIAAGNGMSLGLSWNDPAITVSVTDDQSNDWQQGEIQTTGSARLEIWSAKDCAGAATIVTITFSSGSPTSVAGLHEVDEMGDVDDSASDNGTGLTADTGNMTTTQDDTYIFAYAGLQDFANLSAGAGFTEREAISFSSNVIGMTEDDNTNSAGINNATMGIDASVGWLIGACAFRAPDVGAMKYRPRQHPMLRRAA